MPRKLWSAVGSVKPAPWATRIVALGVVFAQACGGAPPPRIEPDPYGPRVAQCIDAARGVSDMVHEQMRGIPAGEAVLGSSEAERAQARREYGEGGEHLFTNEATLHRARFQGFRIDLSPVTAEAFHEFSEACGRAPAEPETFTEAHWNELRERFGIGFQYASVLPYLWQGRVPPRGREKHPVVLVTQADAAFYCAWRGGRLPTDEEWERAAGGVNGNVYPWGNRYDASRVNTAELGKHETTEVGMLPQGRTAEDLLDMGGHVWEWTRTPVPTAKHQFYVKGNGWDGRGGYGRGAAKVARDEALRNINLGFRCAADLQAR